jgi:hypothetical protein
MVVLVVSRSARQLFFEMMLFCRLRLDTLECTAWLAALAGGSGVHVVGRQTDWAGWLHAQVIEEFMSLADGQIVLEERQAAGGAGLSVDPKASVSRIGSRGYPRALAAMAPQIRCAHHGAHGQSVAFVNPRTCMLGVWVRWHGQTVEFWVWLSAGVGP